MSEFAKLMVGIGIVIVSGFLGFVVAGPIFDAGARSICSTYARDEGLVFIDAEGSPLREGSLHPLPAYSCRFTDPTGSTVIVDESDHLIELTYPYRGQGLAGSWCGRSFSWLASGCLVPWIYSSGLTDEGLNAATRSPASSRYSLTLTPRRHVA